MAFVTSPDGTQGTLDDAELPKALAQGFKVREPTPSEVARARASEQPLVAAAEAAGRAVVPFVGARIVGNIGAEVTGQTQAQALESQRLRKEENPVASALGTGAGFMAGPGKLLKPITTPLRAAGLIGKFGAGALEGTAMGINEAVNESVLENTPLTSERLVASTAASALAGGAIDFGFGAVGRLGSAVLKKAGGAATAQGLRDLGLGAVKHELVTTSALKEFGEANITDAVKRGIDQGIITTGTTYRTGFEAAKAAREAISPRYDALLDGVEAAIPAGRGPARDVLKAVQIQLKQFDRSLNSDAAELLASRLEQHLMSPKVTYREIHALQNGLYESLPSVGVPSGTKKVADAARTAINEALDQQIEAGVAAGAVPGLVGAPGVSAYKKLSKDYASARTLETLFERQFMSAEGRSIGMKEAAVAGAAGIATGGPAGAAVALGGTFLGKQARERGGFLLGGAMREMADSGALKGIASSFQKNVMQRLASAPELLGPFRATIEQAASQGAMDLLQTHMQLAGSEQGQDYMSRMGMVPETPAEMQGMGEKLSAFGALRDAAAAQDTQMNSAIDGIFGEAPGRKGALGSGLSLKEFQRTSAGIQSILRDPEAMYARIDPSIHGSAPGTAGTTAAALVNAARYLDSKMPKSPYAGMPPAVAPQWAPSAADLDRFNRYKEAVESPAQVLKNMSQGYISPEQVDALKAVYPAMYADLQQKIGERLMMQKRPLTYAQKQAMAAVIGPGALGMKPAQVQILQELQGAARGDPSGAQGAGSATKGPDGRQDVGEAGMETEAQKLEKR